MVGGLGLTLYSCHGKKSRVTELKLEVADLKTDLSKSRSGERTARREQANAKAEVKALRVVAEGSEAVAREARKALKQIRESQSRPQAEIDSVDLEIQDVKKDEPSPDDGTWFSETAAAEATQAVFHLGFIQKQLTDSEKNLEDLGEDMDDLGILARDEIARANKWRGRYWWQTGATALVITGILLLN